MASGTSKVWIGFDLGGTKMLAAVYDDKFTLLGRKKRSTKAAAGMQAGLDRMKQTVYDALENARMEAAEIGGMGFGCPGPLDPDKGVLLDPPNLGWRDVPVKATFEKEFGCTVAVANDVDAGTYGEYARGAAKKANTVLGVFPGTGIGGACIYRGDIVRGTARSCMEIGHIQVLTDGPPCGCGQRGCLEAVCSRLAIAGEAAKAAFRGQAPHLLEAAGTDISNIRSGVLASSVAAGDKAVEAIVRRAASRLGVGIGAAVNLLAPDIVLLGGGLVEAMPDLYLAEVERSARQNCMASLSEVFKVVVSKLGDDAVILGAAAWARSLEERDA
jgi:glucokinase